MLTRRLATLFEWQQQQPRWILAILFLTLVWLIWRMWTFSIHPRLHPDEPKKLPYMVPCMPSPHSLSSYFSKSVATVTSIDTFGVTQFLGTH